MSEGAHQNAHRRCLRNDNRMVSMVRALAHTLVSFKP